MWCVVCGFCGCYYLKCFLWGYWCCVYLRIFDGDYVDFVCGFDGWVVYFCCVNFVYCLDWVSFCYCVYYYLGLEFLGIGVGVVVYCFDGVGYVCG